MIMMALCSSLIGAVLGIRFKVLVLCPAMIFGVALVTAVAAFKGSAVSLAIGMVIVWVIFLQLGYLGGLLTRFFLPAIGPPRQPSLRSTAART